MKMKTESYKSPNQQLIQLIEIVGKEQSHLSRIPGWWPAYIDNPQIAIPQIYSGLTQLRQRVQKSTPTLLDCGSGDGTVLSIAALVGFAHTYGIELNHQLSCSACRTEKALERQQVIPQGGNSLAEGSYYLSEFIPTVEQRCYDHLKDLFSADQDEGGNFESFVHQFLGSKRPGDAATHIQRFLNPRPELKPYSTLGIIDTQTARLITDVVYIYPSDPFFETAFLPQAVQLMMPGAVLAVLSPEDDGFQTPSAFSQEPPIPFTHTSQGTLNLQVFRKRDML